MKPHSSKQDRAMSKGASPGTTLITNNLGWPKTLTATETSYLAVKHSPLPYLNVLITLLYFTSASRPKCRMA